MWNQVTNDSWHWYVGYNPTRRRTDRAGRVGRARVDVPDSRRRRGRRRLSGIWIETDPEDQWGDDHIYEWNAAGDAESNNTAKATFHATLAVYPDLVVNPIVVTPEHPQTGEAITVNWRLENHGNAPVESAFADRVRVVNTATGQTLLTEYLPYDPAADGRDRDRRRCGSATDRGAPRGLGRVRAIWT